MRVSPLFALVFCFFSFLFAHLPCSKSSSLFFRKFDPPLISNAKEGASSSVCSVQGVHVLTKRCRDMQCWIRWAARQDSTQAKGWDHKLLCWYDWSISDNARPERRLSCLIHVDQLNHVPIRIRNCRERIGLSERSQICQIQVQKEREDVKSRALTEVNFGLLF